MRAMRAIVKLWLKNQRDANQLQRDANELWATLVDLSLSEGVPVAMRASSLEMARSFALSSVNILKDHVGTLPWYQQVLIRLWVLVGMLRKKY